MDVVDEIGAVVTNNHSEDHYLYMNVSNLLSKKLNKCKNVKCRTVGILKSVSGHFYLNDIHNVSNPDPPTLLVSMMYLNTVPNIILPITVQLFGIMQCFGKPVLTVEIIQVIDPRMAINIDSALTSITKYHCNI